MSLKINNSNKKVGDLPTAKDLIKTTKAVNKAGKKIAKTAKKITKAVKKKALPKKGFKTVAKSVKGENKYKLTNEETLAKYFNKDGSLKKSALRSNKQKQQFEQELKKAKEEIKQQKETIKRQQEELKKLREQLKKDREEQREQEQKLKEKLKKNRESKRKKKKTYRENGGSYVAVYDDFVDLMDEVYDEVSLIFYDSDQVMQWLNDDNISRDDIKDLLIEINKKKEKELTQAEKDYIDKEDGTDKKGKKKRKKLSAMQKEELFNITADIMTISTHSDYTPEQLWNMHESNIYAFEDLKVKYIK